MRAARVDQNQPAIVAALRKAGAEVLSLAPIGRGCPDLLVSFGGDLFMLELKYGKGKTNALQDQWHSAWRAPVYVVRTAEEALAAIGALA